MLLALKWSSTSRAAASRRAWDVNVESVTSNWDEEDGLIGHPGLDFLEDWHEGRAGAAPIGVDFDHVQGRVAFAFYLDGASEGGGRG